MVSSKTRRNIVDEGARYEIARLRMQRAAQNEIPIVLSRLPGANTQFFILPSPGRSCSVTVEANLAYSTLNDLPDAVVHLCWSEDFRKQLRKHSIDLLAKYPPRSGRTLDPNSPRLLEDSVRVDMTVGRFLPVNLTQRGIDIPGVLQIRQNVSGTSFICVLHISNSEAKIEPGSILNRTSIWQSDNNTVSRSGEIATVAAVIEISASNNSFNLK